jgi:hypothetical protein
VVWQIRAHSPTNLFDQSKVTAALEKMQQDAAKVDFRGKSYILYLNNRR